MQLAAIVGFLTVLNPAAFYWKYLRGKDFDHGRTICGIFASDKNSWPIRRTLFINAVLFLLFVMILSIKPLTSGNMLFVISGLVASLSLFATGQTSDKPGSSRHLWWSMVMVVSIVSFMFVASFLVYNLNNVVGTLLIGISTAELIGSLAFHKASNYMGNYRMQFFFVATLSLWMIVLSSYLLFL